MAVVDGSPLSSTVGAVLDPIFSLRCHVRVLPQSTVHVAFWTLIASSRNEALDLVDKHRDAMAFDRATTLAWTQAQVQLRHLGISAGEAHLFQRLANRVLFSDPTLRPSSEVLKRGGGAASKLWVHGISGDLPIVLVRIDEASDLEMVRQVLLAHDYWRMKQLAVDLVILNEHHHPGPVGDDRVHRRRPHRYAMSTCPSLTAVQKGAPPTTHAAARGATPPGKRRRCDGTPARRRPRSRTRPRARHR